MSPFRLILAVAALAAVAACAATPEVPTAPDTPAAPVPQRPQEPGPPMRIEAIVFEAGPCFGFCPDMTITVRPDGHIVYEGRRFTQIIGTQTLPPDPALFDALQRVANDPSLPWPAGDVVPGSPLCGQEATDLPSYAFRLVGPGGRGFRYYAGCFGPPGQRAQAVVENVMGAFLMHGVPIAGVPPRTGKS